MSKLVTICVTGQLICGILAIVAFFVYVWPEILFELKAFKTRNRELAKNKEETLKTVDDNVKDITEAQVPQGNLILSEISDRLLEEEGLGNCIVFTNESIDWRKNAKRIKRYLNDGVSVIIFNPLYLCGIELPFENDKFNVYIRRKNGTKNIHDLIDKDLRRAHNIFRMYIAGSFDEEE